MRGEACESWWVGQAGGVTPTPASRQAGWRAAPSEAGMTAAVCHAAPGAAGWAAAKCRAACPVPPGALYTHLEGAHLHQHILGQVIQLGVDLLPHPQLQLHQHWASCPHSLQGSGKPERGGAQHSSTASAHNHPPANHPSHPLAHPPLLLCLHRHGRCNPAQTQTSATQKPTKWLFWLPNLRTGSSPGGKGGPDSGTSDEAPVTRTLARCPMSLPASSRGTISWVISLASTTSLRQQQ